MIDQHVEYNTLSKADGSAVFCDNKSVILVAIYGPIDISSSKENWEKASVNCIFKRRISTNKVDSKQKFIENFICSTLESSIDVDQYPRTLINIIIQELQCRNDLISIALNASICALMDAGINQKYLIAAVCIGIRKDEKAKDRLILNPNLDELNECTTNLTFVLSNQNFKLISFIHDGCLSIDLFEQSIELAKRGCEDIFKFYKESIRNKFIGSKVKSIETDDSQVNDDKIDT